MSGEELEGLIRQMCDPRSWRVAGALVELARKARESECGCEACVELRALGGALDDITGERP